MGFELNTCHSIEKGAHFSLKSIWTLCCLCVCSHAGWGWGRQSGWDSSAAAYRNGISRKQSCQSPSIKSVSVLSTLPVYYLIWFKKNKIKFAFFSKVCLCGSPKTRLKKSFNSKNSAASAVCRCRRHREGKQCHTCSGKSSWSVLHKATRLVLFWSIKLKFSSTLESIFDREKRKPSPSGLVFQR